MLMRVIKWSNGMVMAFDELGKQIATLQGPFDDVRPSVLREATADTTFCVGNWNNGIVEKISREEWR